MSGWIGKKEIGEMQDEIEQLSADLAIWEGTANQLGKTLERRDERIAKLEESLLHEYTCAVGRGLTEEQAKEALKGVK